MMKTTKKEEQNNKTKEKNPLIDKKNLLINFQKIFTKLKTIKFQEIQYLFENLLK
jgi:hypothetical protein